MTNEQKETAEFIRKSRDTGATGAALAIQLGVSEPTFRVRVKELESLGLDCGKARGPGAVRVELKLPDTTPAK